ncbi:N-acetyltransferase [Polaribacter pacificus]|uniref:N-acetyltransferase n=1 Tax=Polaribacter pacificus TaxID=1775173 RepID=A0A917I0C5_9FLAO|nr:GNAT family N-acetyltransferase [Polaribacter pacificus]GGG97968.1 N-acetyltransferase [Polaribacter pacificus]
MSKSFPVLESKRLLLRQIVATDQEAVFKGLSDPEVIKYYGVSFDSLEATEEQMIWFSELENTKAGVWWAICTKDDNQFLGAAGINDFDKKKRKAEIGFWLYPKNWGQGYVFEALSLILEQVFNNMELDKLEAFVETKNTASVKTLKKLGFYLETTLLNCELKNGIPISLHVFIKKSIDAQ